MTLFIGKPYPFFAFITVSARLVEELAVGVVAEQGLAHRRESAVLKQVQPSLEGVVDIDLAVSADDDDATGAVFVSIVSNPSFRHSQD